MSEVKNERYEDEDGVIYYTDGKVHREDGPAVEWSGGTKEWFIHGKRHREDGPAFEGRNGSQAWFLNGFQLAEEKFNHWIEKKKLNNKLQTTLAPLPQTKRGKI